MCCTHISQVQACINPRKIRQKTQPAQGTSKIQKHNAAAHLYLIRLRLASHDLLKKRSYLHVYPSSRNSVQEISSQLHYPSLNSPPSQVFSPTHPQTPGHICLRTDPPTYPSVSQRVGCRLHNPATRNYLLGNPPLTYPVNPSGRSTSPWQ